jgi:dipeptide transport system substrate-binding protein
VKAPTAPALLLALALAAPVAAQAAGTVTACTAAAPEGFDAVQFELVSTEDAAGIPLYDKLTAFKPGSSEVVPGLAERWEISADGLVYTLHLRKGVKFHSTPWFTPTRTLNADDVLWSIRRVNDKNHPAHGVARRGYVYWAGMNMPALIKSVEKLDDMTVRFTLTRPEAPFLANLAMSAIGSVYSAEYGAQLQRLSKLDQLNTLPIGTGPVVIKSYQKDAVVRYTAHRDYWGGAPQIDNLVFAVTPDSSVRVQRVKAGECLVALLTPDQAPLFAGDANITMARTHPLATVYLAPNAKKRWTGDKRVREALWLAIDKATLIRTVFDGNAEEAASFLPPAMWSHDASLKNRHDPERARRLLREAAYDGSELQMFVRSNRVATKRAAELLQSDWARVGIKVGVQLMELGELYKRGAQGEHDLAYLSWYSDNGDPDNFLTPNLSCAAAQSGSNKAHWCHAPFDALLDEARRTSDTARRTELYRRAQRMLYDEVGLIPLVYANELNAVHKRVTGLRLTPFGGTDFRAVMLR